MPRSKFSKAPAKSKDKKHTDVSSKVDNMEFWLKEFDTEVENRLLALHTSYTSHLDQIEEMAYHEFMLIGKEMGNKTIGELRKEKSISSISTFFDSAATMSFLNSTKSSTQTARKKKVTEDEAETSRGGSEGGRPRRNRSNQRTVKEKTILRQSRSLSRSNAPKNVTIQMPKNTRTTPRERRIVPATFGLVTPKADPNIPLTVLRRPKQGEMAISMQGSPLMISSVVTETCANINIPLGDGRILSMQPNRGLRMSQFPNLDEETKTQLRTLRDNLSKVVQLDF